MANQNRTHHTFCILELLHLLGFRHPFSAYASDDNRRQTGYIGRGEFGEQERGGTISHAIRRITGHSASDSLGMVMFPVDQDFLSHYGNRPLPESLREVWEYYAAIYVGKWTLIVCAQEIGDLEKGDLRAVFTSVAIANDEGKCFTVPEHIPGFARPPRIAHPKPTLCLAAIDRFGMECPESGINPGIMDLKLGDHDCGPKHPLAEKYLG